MKKIFFIIILFLLFSSVSSTSSYDAVTFIRNQNYLKENEVLEEPLNPITINESNYWVIPVTRAQTLITFFVIEFDGKKFSENKIDSRKAITTAYYLRELIKERQRFSDSPTNEWIVSLNHLNFFNSLKENISNKIFELNLIKTEMNLNEINAKVIIVQNKLNAMNLETDKVIETINSALQKETEFISNPSDKTRIELNEKYNSFFNVLENLKNELEDYRKESFSLRASISSSGHQNAGVNIQRANTPVSFQNITKYFNDAQAMNSNIELINSNLTKVDSFMQLNELRKKRNHAFNVLYSQDPEIRNKINQNYSIQRLVEIVLNEENVWVDRIYLRDVENNWLQAENYFSQERYELAEQTAIRARNHAINIYNSGILVPETTELLSFENTVTGIIILIALLALVYIIANKDKLFKKEEEPQNEFY